MIAEILAGSFNFGIGTMAGAMLRYKNEGKIEYAKAAAAGVMAGLTAFYAGPALALGVAAGAIGPYAIAMARRYTNR